MNITEVMLHYVPSELRSYKDWWLAPQSLGRHMHVGEKPDITLKLPCPEGYKLTVYGVMYRVI